MTLGQKESKGPNLRLVVQVSVIEVGGGFLSTSKEAERTWSVEQVVVPIDRVAALDVQGMVDRQLSNVVVIAGQDGK